MKVHKKWNFEQIIKNISPKKPITYIGFDHIDFIIGRGHVCPCGHMNIPLDPMFKKRNHIFIDSDPLVDADIIDLLGDIDFDRFLIFQQERGIVKLLKKLRFIFDWSTFFCSAIYSMVKIARELKYSIEIIVPLGAKEQKIPCEIMDVMKDPIFVTTIQDGFFPLFDPQLKDSDQLMSIINTKKYIKIDVNHNQNET